MAREAERIRSVRSRLSWRILLNEHCRSPRNERATRKGHPIERHDKLQSSRNPLHVRVLIASATPYVPSAVATTSQSARPSVSPRPSGLLLSRPSDIAAQPKLAIAFQGVHARNNIILAPDARITSRPVTSLLWFPFRRFPTLDK